MTLPQPNPIEETNLPGISIGDWADTTPGPTPMPFPWIPSTGGFTGQVLEYNGSTWSAGDGVLQGAQIVSVQDRAYAAPANARRISDGAMTAASPNLTTASWATFRPGMTVYVSGAGPVVYTAGLGCAMRAKVLSSSSVGGGTVVLDTNATTTCSSAQVDYGNSDIAAVQAACNAASAAGGGDVWLPQSANGGAYFFDIDSTSWPNHVTPTGYHPINYAVTVPSNVRVRMPKGVTIRFPFNGSGFDPTACAFTTASNNANVQFDGVVIDGCGVATGNNEQEHYGIVPLDTSDGLFLINCRAHHMYGKGVLTQGSLGYSNFTMAFCHGYKNMGQLATICYTGGQFAHNQCHDNLVFAQGGGAEALIITNCSHFTVDDFKEFNQGTAVAIEGGTANDHITIRGVDSLNPLSIAVPTSDLVISGCNLDVSGSIAGTIGIRCTVALTNATITGNLVVCGGTNNTGAISMTGTNMVDVTAAGNSFIGSGASFFGTSSTTNKNFVISGNLFDGGNLTANVGVTSFTGNTINNAVVILGMSNASIAGNTVTGPASAVYAVTVTGGSNSITGNTFIGNHTGNSVSAFRMTGAPATKNMVSGNVIGSTVSTSVVPIWEQSSAAGNFYIGNTLIGNAYATPSLAAGSIIRSCPIYNPVGTETVTVPATGVAVAASTHDRIYYVTAGASAATVGVTGGPAGFTNTTTITVPAATCVAVQVPAGYTITPTYTVAPTWVVYGN